MTPRLALAAASFVLVACSAQRDDWVDDVVAADPMFAGGAWLEHRLLLDPSLVLAGHSGDRGRFLRERREQHDREGARLVRDLVPAELAAAALPFLRSDAGNALAHAETVALALQAEQPADFPHVTARRFADRTRVGDVAAHQRLDDARAGRIESATDESLYIPATKVAPEDADAIAAFASTAEGRRWLSARASAFARAQRAYAEFVDDALAHDAVARVELVRAEEASSPAPRRDDDDASSTTWVEDVVAADPAFAGGAWLEHRLLADSRLVLAGDPRQRARFLRERRVVHDESAAALVRQLVDEDLAVAALAFLQRDAGSAFAHAELAAIAGFEHQGAAFPRTTAAEFADRTRVGAAARALIQQALEEMVVSHASANPLLVSLVGGLRVSTPQADAIDAFFASDVGKRWLDARVIAFEQSEPRYRAFRDAARAAGFVDWVHSDQEELILPEYAAPDRPDAEGR